VVETGINIYMAIILELPSERSIDQVGGAGQTDPLKTGHNAASGR
jgi:hypothetical protein